MKVNWTVWKPRLLYGAFFALAFLLAMRFTFPAEAVKERLILEAGARGWQIDADEFSAAGFLGISAVNLRAEGANGEKLTAESVRAGLRLLPLLVGRRSVAFDARVWDGRVSGTADLAGDRSLEVRLAAVDLARATPLRRATGLELLGIVDGTVDVALPAEPDAKPAGTVELTVREAGVNGGQLQLASLGGALTVPKVALGEIAAKVSLAEGRGDFDRLEARGGDATFAAEGLYFVYQPRVQNSPLFGKAKLRLLDPFWQKPGTAAFKGVAEMALAPSRTPDGSYELQVFGTLGQPRMRPVAAGAGPARRPVGPSFQTTPAPPAPDVRVPPSPPQEPEDESG